MERFTKRLESGDAVVVIATYGEPPYPMVTKDFVNRLAEYEDLEEDGRLIRLPCKVGDTLFMIKDGEIYDGSVRFMRWENHKDRGIRSDIAANPTPYFSIGASFDDFGKTVFLSKEEAEKTLDR